MVFQAAHVCLRLEEAAAGMWPESGPVSEDEDIVQDAMLRVNFASHLVDVATGSC